LLEPRQAAGIFGVLIWAVLGVSDPGGGQTLWALPDTYKPAPDEMPVSSNAVWSQANSLVQLAAAAGENEGFHLLIRADSPGLDNLEVSVSGLRGSHGVIPEGNVRLFREGFFDVPYISEVWGHPLLGTTGLLPDPLIPFVDPFGSGREIGVPFDVAVGTSRPVWVSVDVPRDAQAGVYIGSLTLHDRDTSIDLATVRLMIEVWDFALPAEPSLHTFYNLERDTVGELYHTTLPSELDTLMANHYQELASRRIGAGYSLHAEPSYDNGTGFDWAASGVDAFYEEWLGARHMPTYGVVPIFTEGEYRIQTPGGAPYTTADLMPGSHFHTQARLFHERVWDYLDGKGWLSKSVVYMVDDTGEIGDEPYDGPPSGYDRLRSWADILHGLDPLFPEKRLRLLVAGDSIIPSAPYADLTGACDVWDMYMDEVDQNGDKYRERFAAWPEEQLWLVPNAYGDFIDYPAGYHRSLGSFAYKHGAKGIEQWDVLAWFDGGENYVDPWVPSNLSPVWGWGAGALFWPGYNIENRGIDIEGPIISLRLELQRQSLEDYEYLALLEGAGLGLVAQALARAAVPGRLFDGVEPSVDQVLRSRRLAGEILHAGGTPTATVQGVVRDTSAAPVGGALVRTETLAVETGSDGSYSITVVPGEHVLNASHRDFLSHAVHAVVAEGEVLTGLDFTIARMGTSVASLFNSFETAGDLWESDPGVTLSRDSAFVSDLGFSMHASFDEAVSDQAIYTEAFVPADWAAYDYLEFDGYSESPYLTELELDIYDGNWTNLFFRIVYLRPGEWNRFRIPTGDIDRAIDLSDVHAMEIYVDAFGKATRDIHLDRFRLVQITGRDTSPPDAPEALTAVGRTNFVDLTWSAPDMDSGGPPLTGLAGYRLYRSETGGGPYDLLNPTYEIAEPAFRDLEVRGGRTYFYTVSAVDDAGNESGASAEASATPRGRGLGTSLRVVRAAGDPSLLWDPIIGAVFRVERSLDPAFTLGLMTVADITEPRFTDTGAGAQRETYFYRVLVED